MSAEEKLAWWQVLASLWGGGTVFPLLLSLLGDHSQDEYRGLICALLIGFAVITGGFLLILSWRATYLSGREDAYKKRSKR